MAAQAIDIVYQLNANDQNDVGIYHQGTSPLEVVSFGPQEHCDVLLPGLREGERILAYRYKDLVIVKNLTGRNLIVQGRVLKNGDLCRIFTGQRILIDDQVLTHQESGLLLQRQEERLPSSDLCHRQRRGRSAFGKEPLPGFLSRSDFRVAGSGNRLERRGCGPQRGPAQRGEDRRGHAGRQHCLSQRQRAGSGRSAPPRARQFGGRFQLKASKSEYLVSNNPGLLEEDDILLSPGSGGEVLLKIYCDYERKGGRSKCFRRTARFSCGGVPVRNFAPLADGDTIRIDAGQVLRCNFSERILEEERNIISLPRGARSRLPVPQQAGGDRRDLIFRATR